MEGCKWDHPRSCGKDTHYIPDKRSGRGSPPLVRERPVVAPTILELHRITPARAGKTASRRQQVRPFKDHPRSCGKDRYIRTSESLHLGSPPLVRERPCDGNDNATAIGDHPRSCGKDLEQYFKVTQAAGSPPLVRERRQAVVRLQDDVGITPARAGKTAT